MKKSLAFVPHLSLSALTAAELMTANPVSIGADATVPEAVAMLADKPFSAAPVIDEAGGPVGVLSRADIVIHIRASVERAGAVHEYYEAESSTHGYRQSFCQGPGVGTYHLTATYAGMPISSRAFLRV